MDNIKPPHTYSEWAEILDMLKNRLNDEAVLSAMQQGTIEWQSGVAERFAQRLINTINTRINNTLDKFQRDIKYAKGQERAIVQALLALRKEMHFLSDAIDLNAIPEKDRIQYRQLVIEQANNVQSSLEDSAKYDRSGRTLSIIRNNKINSFKGKG